MIHKFAALPEVNEQVLISGLEIPRDVTRSVNTSAIFDQQILDDNTPGLKPELFAKSVEKINDCRNWLLDYIPSKPKVVYEALESFKNLIKNCIT